MAESIGPWRFIVERDEDVTGISGVGKIGEGVMFSSGYVITHWLGGPPMYEPKTETWYNKGTGPFEKISGHGGKTRVVWLDEPPQEDQAA